MKLSPRDFSFALLTLLWLSSSGCPLEWGEAGFIDRAVAKDIREQLETETCPDGTEWLDYDPAIGNCVAQDPRRDCRPGCYQPRK